MSYAESHYVYNGTCPSKAAYDVYQLYIKTADGYCRDELQEEDDGTYIIFTRVELCDWFNYHYDLRFQKIDGRIIKSTFKTAAELLQEKKEKENHYDLAVSDSCAVDYDSDDLFCYERLN